MKTTFFAVALVTALVVSQASSAGGRVPTPEPAHGHETVELFKGMEEGVIDVDYIGIDSTKANIIFRNKTKKPLSIKLPEAFAGIPVLKQEDFGGGGDAGGGGGGAQAAGGGIGGGIGGGGGGGFFSVAPEKSGKLMVKTVCLEHGKKDPSPRIKYELKPIEYFTDDAAVIELCKLLGQGRIPQNTAQAAAWHLANGLSWQDLAKKNRYQGRRGTQKWFSPKELSFAQLAATEAQRRGVARAKDPTVLPTGQSDQTVQRQIRDVEGPN